MQHGHERERTCISLTDVPNVTELIVSRVEASNTCGVWSGAGGGDEVEADSGGSKGEFRGGKRPRAGRVSKREGGQARGVPMMAAR
eukprot:scaffold2354_cov124-Isochrysis_galbana.AAC.3